DGQVDFVVGSRTIAEVYYSEVKNLPEADRRRLRRKQRQYIEAWVALLRRARPELAEPSARTLVHASIGVIHSALNYDLELPTGDLRLLLADSACQVLGLSSSRQLAPLAEGA
ncbi:MAG: TetR/AcrR family transcriptional regulator, partial [Acidimicrobiales bacterium]